ncbi:MAG TPA: hypothetical protein VE081_05325 [Sporichthyaceae bacterium]|nr:hypothetical protein [Sporichthyaceae bacterium]
MAAETWLRVVIYRANDPNDQAAVTYLKRSTTATLTMLERRPGFRLGYWGLDPDEGTMAAVTYWSSLESIHDAHSELDKLHAERADHGITIESTQNVQLFAVPEFVEQDDEDKPRHRRRLFGRH